MEWFLGFISLHNVRACYSKNLDSVKNWNDHFFWVDEFVVPSDARFNWFLGSNITKDRAPAPSKYDVEHINTYLCSRLSSLGSRMEFTLPGLLKPYGFECVFRTAESSLANELLQDSRLTVRNEGVSSSSYLTLYYFFRDKLHPFRGDGGSHAAYGMTVRLITVANVATTGGLIPAEVSKDKSAPHPSIFGSSSSSEKTDRTLSLFTGRSGSGFDAESIRVVEAVGASYEEFLCAMSGGMILPRTSVRAGDVYEELLMQVRGISDNLMDPQDRLPSLMLISPSVSALIQMSYMEAYWSMLLVSAIRERSFPLKEDASSELGILWSFSRLDDATWVAETLGVLFASVVDPLSDEALIEPTYYDIRIQRECWVIRRMVIPRFGSEGKIDDHVQGTPGGLLNLLSLPILGLLRELGMLEIRRSKVKVLLSEDQSTANRKFKSTAVRDRSTADGIGTIVV
ncbi:hypothetical protein Tco_0920414 [Tanacetum coccineum]